MDRHDFENQLNHRNKIRAEGQLPLLGIQEELKKFDLDELERAYENFVAEELAPLIEVMKIPKPTNFGQGIRNLGRYVAVRTENEERIKADWEILLRNGHWVQWK